MKLSRFREQFLLLRCNRPQWTLELREWDSLVRLAREQKVVKNATIKHSMHVRDVETRSTRPQIVPTLLKRAEHVEGGSFGKCVPISWIATPKPRGHGKQSKGGNGTSSPKTCWNCGESGHLSSQCPKKKVHAVDASAATVNVAGSQETVMVGAIGSYFDLVSVSEWSLELRGENEGICSVGTASVCEGDVVDIEIDSGAEVSCLPSNIGADTYPLHETRLSMCGGHHVAAGGGKLHELGARILGLETDDVRGNMVNLLVRFRVMEIGKALLSTQDLSRCGWETVFPAGCGDAHLIRKASNTRITLVKKRCAWYLRAKLKPHHELPFTKGEEFLEVMSLD